MSKIYYWHKFHSKETGETKEFSSGSCIPYDQIEAERFSDMIYHSRNSGARFYVVVFGYEKHLNSIFTNKIDRYILHFVMNGKGFFNGEPIQKGDLLISLPNQTYTIQHHQRDPMTFGWISLAGRELELMIEILHLPKANRITLSPDQTERIREVFLDTIYTPHTETEMPYYLVGQLFKILSYAKAPYSAPSMTNNPYIDHALRFINTHYAEKITVADVAKELGLSVSHLRNLFVAELGYSPQQALIDKRMSVAASLMQSDTAMSVQEIADACGYMDQGAFSRRFKRQMGISPTAYQKKLNEETE